uniref:Protein krueppel n=1 Tax=Dendroctonus ponderosae TaxID=77166 RepID=A0AAR5P3A4_DENPD
MEESCRICLELALETYRVPLSSLTKANKTVCQLIKECALIQICEPDKLPQHLCCKCYQQLLVMYDFRELIVSSDNCLKEKIYSKNSIINSPEPDLAFICIKGLPIKQEKKSQQKISYTTTSPQLPPDEKVKSSSENEQFQQSVRKNAGRKPSKVAEKKRKVHEFKCEICKKVLVGRSNRLQQHIIMAHSDIRNFPCNICEKKFKSKQQLVNHSRVHTGEKPYKCDICKTAFASIQSLFNHKKKHTGNHKNYKCAMCLNKGYATPGELETHRRIVHTGEKPFLCELCSRAYSSLRNLVLHKKSVHEKTEKCPKCSLMLSNKRIKYHVQKHLDKEEGIRRYTCDQCGKSFFTQSVLKRHQLLHLNHRPYACQICHKAFSQKGSVETHMKTHSDIRSYSCSLCDKTFKYKQHLQQHLHKKHATSVESLLETIESERKERSNALEINASCLFIR